jgi:Cof subfamily protein (haloacid dehalogenase superfamily)
MKAEPSSLIRLVVTDIDGTLVDRDKVLTPRVLAAAAALRQAGIKLALVSSRPPRGMTMFMGPLGIDTPRAGFNGGEIVSPEGRVLEQLFIPDPAGRLAVEMMVANGIDAWVFADDQWFVTSLTGPYVPVEHRTVRIDPTVVPNFDGVIARATKIMGSTTDFPLLERIETDMMSGFGGSVAAHRSQDYYLDVTHPEARKDHALKRIARFLDVPVHETAALGDMPNDSDMLRVAGLSVAMGNAPEEVQDVAMFVTGTNQHDGWAEAIERHVLPRAPGLH